MLQKCSDAKHHAPLLSSFSEVFIFSVNEFFSYQKLLENLVKMTVANLGRLH